MKKGSKKTLFGTDGIRTQFGKFPLDPFSIVRIGHCIAESINPRRVLIGRDTRISGLEVENLLEEGLGGKFEVLYAGVIPTPALSYNVASDTFELGIMITASHNIWSDNGIKLFGSDGEKLSDKLQLKIEEMFYSDKEFSISTNGKKGVLKATEKYIDFVVSEFSEFSQWMSGVILDCANGAVSDVAPEVYSRLGIEHISYNTKSNGKNINKGCGSTELGFLRQRINAKEGNIGIAFDGDGDRVLMIDNTGNIIDGDCILFVISKYLKESDPDYNPVVVGTIVSNLFLEKILVRNGIKFIRSDVGDRFVYKEMKRNSVVLGGEQSGHIIYRKLQRTGDGIISSLLFLKALNFLNLSISDVLNIYKPTPQTTISIRIKDKRSIKDWDELNSMIDDFYSENGNNSRILIRYSGTEDSIRLMIESEDEKIINKNIEVFRNFLISEIGEEQ